jgi:hypothetical protein
VAATAPTAVPADQKGTSADNQGTEAVSGGAGKSPCPGLPVYSVNTSYLNLAVEDTDFAWQSFGHAIHIYFMANTRIALGVEVELRM